MAEFQHIIIERILTTLVANGLARPSYNPGMINTSKGNDGGGKQWYSTSWFQDFFAKTFIFHLSLEEQASATEFNMTASVIGYAYSFKGTTQKAAIAVLVVYIFLTILHPGYSILGWLGLDAAWYIAKIAMTAMD